MQMASVYFTGNSGSPWRQSKLGATEGFFLSGKFAGRVTLLALGKLVQMDSYEFMRAPWTVCAA
jgi:hypothetical protein